MHLRCAGLMVVVVGLAWSCRRAGPARASSTGSAEVESAGDPTLVPMPESRMDVPLRYDITKVLGVVERAVPARFGSIDSVHQAGNDTRRHYAYQADRGPFTVVADDSVFHLIATLTYEVKGFYKPPIGPTVSVSCGTSAENRPRILIELAAPLTLTAQWRLSSKTSIIRVEPATDLPSDRCRVGIFHQDMTDKIVEAARSAVTRKLPYIDSTIARVDLSGRAQGWWRLLERPIRLSDGVWLALGPERLRLGHVRGEGRTLIADVGIDARPRIMAREEAPDTMVDSVPPLAHGTEASGFHILMEGVVDYRTVSRALNAAVRGRMVSQDNHTIVVDSLRVTPRLGGRLALAVMFHGDANGILRLVGKPRTETRPEGGVITIPDLDYDLETDNPLINAYSWLKSDELRSMFRERALVPDGPAVDRGKALLLAGLNRKIGDAMTLQARVDTVAVRGLYVRADGLVIRAEATGRATVAVKER